MTQTDNEKLACFCGWKLETRKYGPGNTRYRYTLDGHYNLGPEGIYGFGFHDSRKIAAQHLPDYSDSMRAIHEQLEPALAKADLTRQYVAEVTHRLLALNPERPSLAFDVMHASEELRAQAALAVIKRWERRTRNQNGNVFK